jgi:Sec-independent protein translocase protein TatA
MGLAKFRLFPSITLGILDIETIGILVLVVAVVFGSSRLPKIARGLREARDEFQRGRDDGAKGSPPQPAPPQAAPPPAQTPSPAPPIDPSTPE